MIQTPESWIMDPGSRIVDPGYWILDPGSWILDIASRGTVTTESGDGRTVFSLTPGHAFHLVHLLDAEAGERKI